MQLQLRMRPAGRAENITLVAPPPVIDPDSGEVSQMIDERAIADLPLGTPLHRSGAFVTRCDTGPARADFGVDGDLSYGGTRGYQNSYLVDGADNNNSFYAQARSILRAVPVRQRSD
jgi:hypothetical protein